MNEYTEKDLELAKQQLSKIISKEFVETYLSRFIGESLVKFRADYDLVESKIGQEEKQQLLHKLRSNKKVNVNGALSQIYCTAYFARCGFDIGPPLENPNGKVCDFSFKGPQNGETVNVEVYSNQESQEIADATRQLLDKIQKEPVVIHAVDVQLSDMKKKVERKSVKSQLVKGKPNILVVRVGNIDILATEFIKSALNGQQNTRLTAVIVLSGGFRPNTETRSLDYEYRVGIFRHRNPAAPISEDVFQRISTGG